MSEETQTQENNASVSAPAPADASTAPVPNSTPSIAPTTPVADATTPPQAGGEIPQARLQMSSGDAPGSVDASATVNSAPAEPTREPSPTPVTSPQPSVTPVVQPINRLTTEQVSEREAQIPPPAAPSQQENPVPAQTGAVSAITNLLLKARERIQFRKRKKLEKVLALAQSRKQITNNDVEQALRVSDKTVERYLNQLIKEGKLRRTGKPKRPKYEPI